MITMRAYVLYPPLKKEKVIYATENNVKEVLSYCLQKYGSCVVKEIPEQWLEEMAYEFYEDYPIDEEPEGEIEEDETIE